MERVDELKEVRALLSKALKLVGDEIDSRMKNITTPEPRAVCDFCEEYLVDVIYISRALPHRKFCCILCREKAERDERFRMLEQAQAERDNIIRVFK